jgi:hypothetical protein
MQATTQARMPLSRDDAERFLRMAELYGSMKRKQDARIASEGRKAEIRV